MIAKQIHGQDAYYKLSAKNSGETSLNLSNELLRFIAPDLEKGNERSVTFMLNREDYLKALGYIFNLSPLYTSSSNSSTKVDGNPIVFAKDFTAVCEFFGSNEKKEYTVNMLYKTDGRIYLNSLEDKNSKFNIRHFLVEDHSTLVFERDNNTINITLKLENPSHLVREKGVNAFAREVCLYFSGFDGLSQFLDCFKESQAGYMQLESQGTTLSRFLNPNIDETLRGNRWFEDIFEISGKQYLLCSEWTENKNKSNVPSLEDFDIIIRNVYNGRFIISKEDGFFILKDTLSSGTLTNTSSNTDSNPQQAPLQRIFYGAPGTGKSHKIDEQTNDDNSIRTTFHPDTDYATFVGAYKPMMDTVDEYALDATGKTHKIDYPNGKSSIIYKFEPQVFLKAYVEAWERYLNKQEGEDDSYYLVIEEINRGNCAQIFGDLFQLLDREDNGYSSYAISPESAITKYLAEDAQSIDGTKYSDLEFREVVKDNGKIIATIDELKKGQKLVLPPNLYIWATMNTSDQSLFPIDSAFKRRWDWKYMPINTKKENWTIKIGDKDYSWSLFLEKINEEIDRTTHSEDKMLGFYFCRANNGVIDADKFVSKVLFYIYNDVFKDYGFDREMFKDEDGKVISFKSYYNTDGTINESKVERFLDNLTKDKE